MIAWLTLYQRQTTNRPIQEYKNDYHAARPHQGLQQRISIPISHP
jgi:hypothetical protein